MLLKKVRGAVLTRRASVAPALPTLGNRKDFERQEGASTTAPYGVTLKGLLQEKVEGRRGKGRKGGEQKEKGWGVRPSSTSISIIKKKGRGT